MNAGVRTFFPFCSAVYLGGICDTIVHRVEGHWSVTWRLSAWFEGCDGSVFPAGRVVKERKRLNDIGDDVGDDIVDDIGDEARNPRALLAKVQCALFLLRT